jgi:hypothetical protein
MDTPTSFIWIVVFFDEGSKYGMGAKFWNYVAKTAETLCVVLYNFVQWHIFVNYYLTC